MGISETIFIFAWLYKIKATHVVVAQLAERRLPKPQGTRSTQPKAAGHEFDPRLPLKSLSPQLK